VAGFPDWIRQDMIDLAALACPVVVEWQETADLPSVRIAEPPGVEAAVAYLLAHGHRAIAWIGPPIAETPVAKRRAGALATAALRDGFAWEDLSVPVHGAIGAPGGAD
jgi:DNA-binding LacI/PurR family transcriptional regulator